MTSLLEQLLEDYGFLAAMVRNLDAAREVWARLPAIPDIGMNQYRVDHFFMDAYSTGASRLRERTPMFLYGMCLVHGHGLLEHYLTEIIRKIVQTRPQVLLTNKKREERKIDVRLVIDNLESPEKMLDELVRHELLKLTYGSMREFIDALRDKFGLSSLPRDLDGRICQLSLIRNCLIHNRGVADARLSMESNKFYDDGQRIHVDRNMVSRSITIYCRFAAQVDKAAANTHFGKR